MTSPKLPMTEMPTGHEEAREPSWRMLRRRPWLRARFRQARVGWLIGAVLAMCVIGASASEAEAQNKILLNGVDITGVTDQTFENATITIDGNGNVLIDAPDYAVAVEGESEVPDQPAQPTGSYYLIMNNTKPGSVQYELDFFLNGALIKTFKDSQSQIILEVTDNIVPGRNTVSVKARKTIIGERKSLDAQHKLILILGKGSRVGQQFKLQEQLVSYSVDASQEADLTKNIIFQVK